MGFAVYYRSMRPLAPAEADAIRRSVGAANEGRSWLSCEPVALFPDDEDGHLSGGSKPDFGAHWDEDADDPLPDGTLRDVIDILARVGREFGVDWQLSHDHEPDLGRIRAGVCDERALAQIEALAEMSASLGAFVEDGDFDDEAPPAEPAPAPPAEPRADARPAPAAPEVGRGGEPRPGVSGVLPSRADFCLAFPPCVSDYRDMRPYVDHWESSLPSAYTFHPGPHGGGVFTFPMPESYLDARKAIWPGREQSLDTPRGMVLGNAGGAALARRVYGDSPPHRPPGWAVKAGLAEAVPEMKVAVTAEHLSLGGRRILLVVPKAKRRSLALLDQLPEWFAPFGVSVEGPAPDVLPRFRGEAAHWFGDASRPMYAFSLSGGEEDVGWQVAVTCHVAQHWERKARGLDSIHLVADIEGEPNFRPNWTSNR